MQLTRGLLQGHGLTAGRLPSASDHETACPIKCASPALWKEIVSDKLSMLRVPTKHQINVHSLVW